MEINQLNNPDVGEPPLFECAVSDGTAGVVLAANVRGSSKKIAKNEACKIATKKLWDLRMEAGDLLEEEKDYLKRFEQAQREGTPLVTTTSSSPEPGHSEEDPSLPVKISTFERQVEVVMLLNQLHAQKRLQVRFDFEDLSPAAKETTEFQCTAFINGEQMGLAKAVSKKKARSEAAKQAFDMALEKNLVFYWTPSESDDDDEVQQS